MLQAFWVLIIVLVMAIGFRYLRLGQTRQEESRRPVAGQHGEIESAQAYKNHLAMARWIELQLRDDLVRSSVVEEEQARAKRLLAEFYGDDQPHGG